MKKIICVVVILLLAGTAFSYDIMEQDGWDWVSWDEGMKIFYLNGWFSAYGSLYERSYYMQGEFTEEASDLLMINGKIGEVLSLLDAVYSDPEHRDVPLTDAVLIVTGKDYWNE